MNWGYVCGFMDGEGWVSFHERVDARGNTTLDHNIGCCQSTPQDVCLKEIQKFLESEGIEAKIHIARNNGPRRHPVSKLYIQGNRDNKIKFLRHIISGCFIKNIKAQQLLVAFQNRPVRNTQRYPELRENRCIAAVELYKNGVGSRLACRSVCLSVAAFNEYAKRTGTVLRSAVETRKLSRKNRSSW